MTSNATTPKPGEWRWATVKHSKERMIVHYFSHKELSNMYAYGDGRLFSPDQLTDISEPIVDPLALNKKGKRV